MSYESRRTFKPARIIYVAFITPKRSFPGDNGSLLRTVFRPGREPAAEWGIRHTHTRTDAPQLSHIDHQPRELLRRHPPNSGTSSIILPPRPARSLADDGSLGSEFMIHVTSVGANGGPPFFNGLQQSFAQQSGAVTASVNVNVLSGPVIVALFGNGGGTFIGGTLSTTTDQWETISFTAPAGSNADLVAIYSENLLNYRGILRR